jgi:tetratricopeptide (TPR) repeat protein
VGVCYFWQMNKLVLRIGSMVWIAAMAMAGCQNDQPKGPLEIKKAKLDSLSAKITELESIGKDQISMEQQASLFKIYQDYYNTSGNDTTSLNYLFEAANLAQVLGKYQKSIELFINFHDGFPTSHRCDEAVFNIAYIYDSKLRDPEKAALYYNKVIEMYPNSMWAKEANAALHFVGLSDEAIIKKLEEINKK